MRRLTRDSMDIVLSILTGGFILGLSTLAHSQLPVETVQLASSHTLDQLSSASVSGGVPKDGIPAIDNPQFQTASEANDFLQPDDMVFGAVLDGEAKAYPRRILVWHEIVNDQLGGENVSVTYCPLTGTAIGFKRGSTTFGVSGNLVNNNLVMYDRETDSRWPQMLGTAISGPHKGKSLQRFRVVWTTWEDWRALHPDTLVLSRRTGYARDYFRDPYGGGYNPPTGYYAAGNPTFPTLHNDARMAPKVIVTGARIEEGAAAFRKSALRDTHSADIKVRDITLTAFYDARLDTVHVYRNPEQRTFRYSQGRFSSEGDSWQADQLPLEKVHAFDAMWFAWVAFFPETETYE